MNTIDHLIIETDGAAGTDGAETAARFYTEALGLADRVRVRPSGAPSSGFRGCTLSLVVATPATADAFMDAARSAGAAELKSAKRSLFGYGGAVTAPDGTVVTIAAASKKGDGGPSTREVQDLVLQLGVADVDASRRFYDDRGLTVGQSYGKRYVQFETGGVTLALLKRPALAKTAGLDPEGTGSHRLAIAGDAGAFTDPDGYAWEGRQSRPVDSQ